MPPIDGLEHIIGVLLLREKREKHSHQHSHADGKHHPSDGKTRAFTASAVLAAAGVGVFGVDWPAPAGPAGAVLTVLGLLLWSVGFADAAVADWRTRTFNVAFLWCSAGGGCCLFAAVHGGWGSAASAGGAAACCFWGELMLRDRRVTWRNLLSHGDADMGFLAAFPAGVFTGPATTADVGGWAALGVAASTGFMVFALATGLKLFDRAGPRRHGRGAATHFGMVIFFAGAAVWGSADWAFTAAATF